MKILGKEENKMQTITIADIEITLELNENLQSIDITCNKIGYIHGDVDTIFGNVKTVDGTVTDDITGDVLGQILSNIKNLNEFKQENKK